MTMIRHESLQAASWLDPRLDSCGMRPREVDDMTPPRNQDAALKFGTEQKRHLQSTQCLSSTEGRPF
ncbi:hypothetical protein [Synechococcus sp. BIOS-U3-1]|uniref:hypothetical protein n=1 Tax=Synechococcus sp. BIOS-U3-1 TaxID=1400865 RepID=UPI002107718D|nr:hypothetical protein [Synechococcus sp. BIOS-U3-1]